MFKYLFVVIILISLLLISCQPNSLTPKEYLEWVENPRNHFQQKKLVGENEYIVQYGSIDYICAQQALQSGVAQAQKRRREESNEFVYLKFRIQDVGKSINPLEKNVPNEETYYQRLNYLTFGIEEDLLFLEGTDTLGLRSFQFVRNYALAPYLDYVLTFERKNIESQADYTFIYKDKLFGAGEIRLKFEKSLLAKVPTLEL